MSRVFSLLLMLVIVGTVRGQAKTEPLAEKVKASITRGVRHLIEQQKGDGSWEATQADYQGGSTALALLALLNCDGVLDDADLEHKRKGCISLGINYLRTMPPSTQVYVRSLQTMALVEAGRGGDPLIQKNVDWLIAARQFEQGKFIGWYYTSRVATMSADASNSQYAMLALWYARQAGARIDRKVWIDIRDYYTRSQNDDGSWIYSKKYGPSDIDKDRPSVTMTVAGLCGVLIAGMELNDGREEWTNGRVKNCGVYNENLPAAKALHWINNHFTLELEQRTYYHLYGLERAGRLSGQRLIGEHDWYREGSEFLTKRQESNGSWSARGGWDRWPIVNTSFALLFLSKGRTPVLISKLVHGPFPRREDDTDWNNDRNDLRHLTEYVARNTDLFGKKPLAWQTYDIRRAIETRLDQENVADRDQESAVVADMLQAPILYITGHQSPLQRIQAGETALIKRFVENGGLIFAEACCDSEKFDAGIKAWVEKTWEDGKLEYLSASHPVWTCLNKITPGEPYKLMGLQVGCRTVMIYSPQDLSCYWESNRLDDGRTQIAFRLGANIVAYATGRVPPQPRLTAISIAAEKPSADPKERGYFQVGQLRFRGDDWQPAPKAMSNLMLHVHELTGLDVLVKPRQILVSDRSDVIAAKFLYMHGRKDFRVQADHLEALRFTLENGGLLFADACCGDEEFDKSFRKFAQDLFPRGKLERVPTGDVLFSADRDLKLEALTAKNKNIKCRVKANGPVVEMEPYLEGIRVDGRWVLLYSKYDLGCALERNTSAGCVGYDHASAMRIATAVVRYNMRP